MPGGSLREMLFGAGAECAGPWSRCSVVGVSRASGCGVGTVRRRGAGLRWKGTATKLRVELLFFQKPGPGVELGWRGWLPSPLCSRILSAQYS